MRQPGIRLAGAVGLALLLAGVAWISWARWRPAAAAQFDWLRGWTLPPGFALQVDQDSLSYPTALAFVPDPGADPLDPLYFVTELGGTIKVVSNDRRVTTFASLPTDAAAYQFSNGLAGICLDPVHGYVFTTLARRDETGLLHNQIVRYSGLPRTFGRASTATLLIPSAFVRDQATGGNQVGGCQVDGEALYVGVGDGANPAASRRLDGWRGKLLRLTLDGQPYPGNPLASSTGPGREAAAYVWASGLRNPFGLKLLGGELFVADNGPEIDRFLHVTPGQDYAWNGTNWSIGTGARTVFDPAIGPVQIDRYPGEQPLFPAAYRQRFYIAAAGSRNWAGVVSLPYDLSADRAVAAPTYFLRSPDVSSIWVTGLAFGPDGLYVAAFTTGPGSRGAVLRIVGTALTPDLPPTDSASPAERMAASGCLACHEFNGVGSTAAATLNHAQSGGIRARLIAWLSSAPYTAGLDQLDALDQEPFRSLRAARDAVRSSVGPEKARVWIQQHASDRRFDDPNAAPPSVALTADQAVGLSELLIPPTATPSLPERILNRIRAVLAPVQSQLLAGLAGLVVGVVGAGLALLARRGRQSAGTRRIARE
jgi:glucose/sorbosone dehydrogenase